jgi:hypothetical protein
MINIEFPEPAFRIKKEDGRNCIFDELRKKWLFLTPEEWVRQNFVKYLVKNKKYPAARIALEKEIQLGELKKRFDVLVYDNAFKPWMMIECKSTGVILNDEVLRQLLRYNISVPVEYMIITNGSSTYGWQKVDSQLVLINELPAMQL